MNFNLPISAKSFAHLISGRGVVSAKKAKEEDEDEEEEEEEEEGKEKGSKAEDETPPADDKEDNKKGKKAKGKKCEDDDKKKDDEKMSEEEEKDEEEKEDRKKEGKKKASAEGFDAATLARCEAIFLSEHATGRPDMAAELAFNSNLSADQAIAVMKLAGPAAKVSRLADRMSTVKNPDVGASAPKGGSADAATQLASSIVGAYNKVLGEA